MNNKKNIMKRTLLQIAFFILTTGMVTIFGCNKDDENKNQPPSCIIVSPEEGDLIRNFETVTISVEAIDSDGILEEVRFYIDDIGKGSAKTFPYNFEWELSEVQEGVHIIKALAIDSDGGQNEDVITIQTSYTIPCPGIETVSHGGQEYHAVLIGDQCWLKENLNIGTMVPGEYDMEDNNQIEKYCYDDDPTNCDIYGGLYQWDEMMQYSTIEGGQGICPNGWHIPTDDDWKILEGTVDSQYPINDYEWDWEGYRGFDAGNNLKSNTGWAYSQNGVGSDIFGFSALPGGKFANQFEEINFTSNWWTSTTCDSTSQYYRSLSFGSGEVYRHCIDPGSTGIAIDGIYVRCIRD